LSQESENYSHEEIMGDQGNSVSTSNFKNMHFDENKNKTDYRESLTFENLE